MKPLLPTAGKLAPYLARIDESRHYTNFGELNAEYQQRISELFGCPCISGSSATSLITATLMALGLPKGSRVALPSYTFPATASAVVSAGLVPYFFDCREDGIARASDAPLEEVSAIILVSAFGAPNDYFRLVGGYADIPIIIDAAAGFDTFSTICKPDKYPMIVSTHSTKAFGTGEGGLLFWRDDYMLERVRRITNFGLTPDRRIEYTGLNAKFSEYHAAVGLAELDGWSTKRLKLLEAVKPYGIDYAVTQVPVRGEGKMNIYGCHIHEAYNAYPCTEMKVTNELIANVGAVMVGI